MNRSQSKKARSKRGIAKYRIFTSFLLLTLIFETVYRLNLDTEFFGKGLFYIFIFAIPSAIIYTAIVSLFGRKISTVLKISIGAISCIFYISQMCYYKIFGTYYTLYSALNGGDAFQFKASIFEGIFSSLPYAFIDIIALLGFIFLSLQKSYYIRLNLKSCLRGLLLALITFIIAFISLLAGGISILSTFDTYMNADSSSEMKLECFGIATTFRRDCERYIFNFSGSSGLSFDGMSDEQGENKEYEPNILDIDFMTLAEGRSDETLKNMDMYFNSLQPTYKNEKTGIYKDYNLIYITAEAFSPYVIDENLTPTLYKMYTQGYNFTNFYNPIWGVSTSDGEYVNCQGLIPKSGVWSMSKSHDNYLPFTFGNQFRRLGYDTKAYHNHTYTYYDRDLSHPNMGYDYKGLGNGLDVTKVWPESDLEMMEKTIDEYINSERFHVYYMSVSGHMLYTWGGNMMASRNRDAVANLPYSEACKAYFACNIEFDKAMEYLLKRLEEAGIADKTVIAIAADHYPYGLENSEISEFLGHEVDTQFELYKSCFLLYVNGMESQTVDKYCSTMDIVPTLSNMFGLEYDSRLLMGKDIFSDASPLVVFNSKNWITDKGSCIASKGEFYPFEFSEEENYEEYMAQINARVANMFKLSTQILDNDYYRSTVSFDDN